MCENEALTTIHFKMMISATKSENLRETGFTIC